jgi:hypothetical protein
MEGELDPKFEIVELYPMYGIKGKKLVLNAHVYIVDWDLDIRGFVVHYQVKPDPDDLKRQNMVYFPMAKSWDYEEKRVISFPTISTISGKWGEKIKVALIKAAEEKFKKFLFPENFPKSYFVYLEMGKDKEKIKLRPDKTVKPIKENKFFKTFVPKNRLKKT